MFEGELHFINWNVDDCKDLSYAAIKAYETKFFDLNKIDFTRLFFGKKRILKR